MEFTWNLRPNSWKQACWHSRQSNLLTVLLCICSPGETVRAGKDCGGQNPFSECSCEHHSHAYQPLTHWDKHFSLNLNVHISHYLSLPHWLFSLCSVVLSLCPGKIFAHRGPGHTLPELDNFVFQGGTILQQCRATGFKAVSMVCIKCPAGILLQINCFIIHKNKRKYFIEITYWDYIKKSNKFLKE